MLPLCDFIKVYYERLSHIAYQTQASIGCNSLILDQFKMPSLELLRICIEQIQACEIDKFRNLNKLAILINLIGSLLRSTNPNGLFISNDANPYMALNNSRICIQLTKSLVQIINTFNVGRGGLSLSFMGNYITKSAHVSLLQLVKQSLASSDSQMLYKTEIVKAVLCLKDQKNSLQGSSWLTPLMLHREPQIRSISFCLISLLINVPFARQKLLASQTGIWAITFNILLDHSESSIVRAQACSLLINLTQYTNPNRYDDDEVNIRCSFHSF